MDIWKDECRDGETDSGWTDGWTDGEMDQQRENLKSKSKQFGKKLFLEIKSSHWTNKSARIYYPSFFNMIMLFCSIYQGLSCSWTVIAPVGYHLQITYKKFEVHSGPRWEHYAACHFHKSYVTFVVVFFICCRRNLSITDYFLRPLESGVWIKVQFLLKRQMLYE